MFRTNAALMMKRYMIEFKRKVVELVNAYKKSQHMPNFYI